ncbi:Uncharacterised protein [Halioglobus japonicus]|nr:Uncharacterised protein [Halioglobus japonicus]
MDIDTHSWKVSENSVIALRTVGVLFVDAKSIESGDPRLGGERIYGSEQLVREFTGDIYSELKPL